METAELEAPARLTVLAERLDCLTEADLLLLADVTPATAETWRKRGEGPAYIRLGRSRVLYPRTSVVEWLAGRLRERKAVPMAGVL